MKRHKIVARMPARSPNGPVRGGNFDRCKTACGMIYLSYRLPRIGVPCKRCFPNEPDWT